MYWHIVENFDLLLNFPHFKLQYSKYLRPVPFETLKAVLIPAFNDSVDWNSSFPLDPLVRHSRLIKLGRMDGEDKIDYAITQPVWLCVIEMHFTEKFHPNWIFSPIKELNFCSKINRAKNNIVE